MTSEIDELIERAEVTTGAVLLKKVFWKISQNSQENTCARVSFFNKVAGLKPATLLKRDSGTGVFLSILRNF